METTDCIFGHKNSEVAFSIVDRLGDDVFQVRRCSECGLLFVSPRPTLVEIGAYYPYSDYKEEFTPAIGDEPSRLRRWNRTFYLNKLCRFVENVQRRGRLLDVGCATGNFLVQMRQRGDWQVEGVDITSDAVAYARGRFGLEVFHGQLEQARYETHAFDVVTMWNVIEHLHDPLATLREVHRVLRPNGWLAASIPNADALDARLFGASWVGLDVPRHLYIPGRRTLPRLFRLAGFEIVKVSYCTGGYHSFVTSAQMFLAQRPAPGWRRWSRTLARLIGSLPVHILLIPYLRLIEMAGYGAIFHVLARPIQE